MRWFAVAPVALVVIVLGGCSPTEQTPDPLTPPADVDNIAVSQPILRLDVGECLMDISTPIGQDLTDIPVIDCDEPHDSEVFAEIVLTGTGFPGVDQVMADGSAGCIAAFGEFIGIDYPSSTLDFSYYYPTASSWAVGDRSVFCVVFDPGTLTTGTLAESQR